VIIVNHACFVLLLFSDIRPNACISQSSVAMGYFITAVLEIYC